MQLVPPFNLVNNPHEQPVVKSQLQTLHHVLWNFLIRLVHSKFDRTMSLASSAIIHAPVRCRSLRGQLRLTCLLQDKKPDPVQILIDLTMWTTWHVSWYFSGFLNFFFQVMKEYTLGFFLCTVPFFYLRCIYCVSVKSCRPEAFDVNFQTLIGPSWNWWFEISLKSVKRWFGHPCQSHL